MNSSHLTKRNHNFGATVYDCLQFASPGMLRFATSSARAHPERRTGATHLTYQRDLLNFKGPLFHENSWVRPFVHWSVSKRRDAIRHDTSPASTLARARASVLPSNYLPFGFFGTRAPGDRSIEFHAHATPLHRRNQVLALFFSIRPISHTVYTIDQMLADSTPVRASSQLRN